MTGPGKDYDAAVKVAYEKRSGSTLFRRAIMVRYLGNNRFQIPASFSQVAATTTATANCPAFPHVIRTLLTIQNSFVA
jgi:hypothetical protein